MCTSGQRLQQEQCRVQTEAQDPPGRESTWAQRCPCNVVNAGSARAGFKLFCDTPVVDFGVPSAQDSAWCTGGSQKDCPPNWLKAWVLRKVEIARGSA